MNKVIENYKNYTISDIGVIVNIIRNRELKPVKDKDGYLEVNLSLLVLKSINICGSFTTEIVSKSV